MPLVALLTTLGRNTSSSAASVRPETRVRAIPAQARGPLDSLNDLLGALTADGMLGVDDPGGPQFVKELWKPSVS